MLQIKDKTWNTLNKVKPPKEIKMREKLEGSVNFHQIYGSKHIWNKKQLS